MEKNNIEHFIKMILIVVTTVSCQDFLNVKPDRRMTTPASLEDVQSMLDNVNYINTSYAPLGEVSSDTYYLLPSIWSALTNSDQRNEYLLNNEPVSSLHWAIPYRAIFTANTALEALDEISGEEKQLHRQLRGTALFHRGRYFLNLAEVFSKTYSEEHLDDLSVVLKLSADINDPLKRSTIRETYEQIIHDLTEAATLLSTEKPPYPTRPNKFTAYSVLAQTYLTMSDFERAFLYADSCLRGNGEILIEDFTLLPITNGNPFKRHGKEVLFYSRFTSAALLTKSRACIDTNLLALYHKEDLRREHYFQSNPDGTCSFKGDYSLNTGATYFNGITIPEVLLIRAECYARKGELELAKNDLRRLLEKRYKPNYSPDLSHINTSEELLKYILEERRKELVFRGVRWSDLRRTSRDPKLATGVVRWLNGQKYELKPSDIYKYAHKLPNAAIEDGSLVQN